MHRFVRKRTVGKQPQISFFFAIIAIIAIGYGISARVERTRQRLLRFSKHVLMARAASCHVQLALLLKERSARFSLNVVSAIICCALRDQLNDYLDQNHPRLP